MLVEPGDVFGGKVACYDGEGVVAGRAGGSWGEDCGVVEEALVGDGYG